jgi:hypothetical protein
MTHGSDEVFLKIVLDVLPIYDAARCEGTTGEEKCENDLGK